MHDSSAANDWHPNRPQKVHVDLRGVEGLQIKLSKLLIGVLEGALCLCRRMARSGEAPGHGAEHHAGVWPHYSCNVHADAPKRCEAAPKGKHGSSADSGCGLYKCRAVEAKVDLLKVNNIVYKQVTGVPVAFYASTLRPDAVVRWRAGAAVKKHIALLHFPLHVLQCEV